MRRTANVFPRVMFWWKHPSAREYSHGQVTDVSSNKHILHLAFHKCREITVVVIFRNYFQASVHYKSRKPLLFIYFWPARFQNTLCMFRHLLLPKWNVWFCFIIIITIILLLIIILIILLLYFIWFYCSCEQMWSQKLQVGQSSEVYSNNTI